MPCVKSMPTCSDVTALFTSIVPVSSEQHQLYQSPIRLTNYQQIMNTLTGTNFCCEQIILLNTSANCLPACKSASTEMDESSSRGLLHFYTVSQAYIKFY